MSKIKELRSNPENVLNLVSVLELISPEGKSKYTDLLLRLMKTTPNIKEHVKEIKTCLSEQFPFISKEKFDEFGDIQLMMMFKFFDSFFNFSDLKSFRNFCEYNERNLVEQNDLTKYKSFDEIMNAVSIAEMKINTKDMENQIVKVFENDEWLLLKPLTYLASKKYGANTKWCTTSEGNPDYFIKYSSKGVLIYCINKKSGYKVASFCSLDKNDPEFSFWNQKDTRVDSLDTELTDELRTVIYNESKGKGAKTNRFLLSDDQRMREDDLLKHDGLYKSGAPVSEPVYEGNQRERRARRIEGAIRRENEDVTEQEEPMVEMESSERETIIERMRWTSEETAEDSTESFYVGNDQPSENLTRG